MKRRRPRQWHKLLLAVACLLVCAGAAETDESDDATTTGAAVFTAAVTMSKNETPNDASCDDSGENAETPAAPDPANRTTARTASPPDAANTTSNADQSTSATPAGTKSGEGQAAVDELHGRVARLTNDLGKAKAALIIAQKNEHKLAILEKEKYWWEFPWILTAKNLRRVLNEATI